MLSLDRKAEILKNKAFPTVSFINIFKIKSIFYGLGAWGLFICCWIAALSVHLYRVPILISSTRPCGVGGWQGLLQLHIDEWGALPSTFMALLAFIYLFTPMLWLI